MYSIRAATPLDADGIRAVSSYLGYDEVSTEESKTKLDQLLFSTVDTLYVVESDQVIVAWLHLFLARRLASPDFYEIGGLVVHPDFRRQGIGCALVKHVVVNLEGKVRVRCNEKRHDAHVFYGKLGFECSKIQRVFET